MRGSAAGAHRIHGRKRTKDKAVSFRGLPNVVWLKVVVRVRVERMVVVLSLDTVSTAKSRKDCDELHWRQAPVVGASRAGPS